MPYTAGYLGHCASLSCPQTIKAVQPDVVLVELCKSRVDILKYDEELLLREAKNIDMQKLRLAIRQVSWVQMSKQSSVI